MKNCKPGDEMPDGMWQKNVKIFAFYKKRGFAQTDNLV